MQSGKIRARMVTEFESLLKDESAHVAKYKRTSVPIKLAGVAFLLVGVAIAGMPWDWPNAAATLFAAASDG